MQIVTEDIQSRFSLVIDNLRPQHEECYGLHYRLSQLETSFHSPYQTQIALRVLNHCFIGQHGHIFAFDNHDIIVICHHSNHALLEKAIFQLRFLYQSAPLAYTKEGNENDQFCQVYDLEFQWSNFEKLIQDFLKETTKPTLTYQGEELLEPLSSANLELVLQELDQLDPSLFIRHQSICALLTPNAPPTTLFHEYFMGSRPLRKALSLPIDLLGNEPLFKFLTENLDAITLNYISTQVNLPDSDIPDSFSMNLNSKTILTEYFAAFDETIPQERKSSIILEFQLADVFENINRFHATRQMAKELGYRICLDGIELSALTYIVSNRLECDLYKIRWNQIAAHDLTPEEITQLTQLIQQSPANRTILCHCDHAEAIRFGHELGIGLFQGYHIDRLLYTQKMAESKINT